MSRLHSSLFSPPPPSNGQCPCTLFTNFLLLTSSSPLCLEARQSFRSLLGFFPICPPLSFSSRMYDVVFRKSPPSLCISRSVGRDYSPSQRIFIGLFVLSSLFFFLMDGSSTTLPLFFRRAWTEDVRKMSRLPLTFLNPLFFCSPLPFSFFETLYLFTLFYPFDSSFNAYAILPLPFPSFR